MTIKERPKSRAAIIKQGLRPVVVDGRWDGRYYLTADGKVRSAQVDPMSKQMKVMAQEGYWGEIVIDPKITRDILQWIESRRVT